VFDVKKGKASKAMRGSKKHYYSTPQKQRELWRWSLALATTNSQHAKAEPTGAHTPETGHLGFYGTHSYTRHFAALHVISSPALHTNMAKARGSNVKSTDSFGHLQCFHWRLHCMLSCFTDSVWVFAGGRTYVGMCSKHLPQPIVMMRY